MLTVPSGVVASYVHQPVKPGLGKIGVLVAVEGDSEIDALETLGRQVGMHVAATQPRRWTSTPSTRRRWSARRPC